jgi:hypothetical protein
MGGSPAGIDISADGSELAVAIGSDGYGDGWISFVDLETWNLVATVVPGGSPYSEAFFDPVDVVYGRPDRLYSIHADGGTVHVYDRWRMRIGSRRSIRVV